MRPAAEINMSELDRACIDDPSLLEAMLPGASPPASQARAVYYTLAEHNQGQVLARFSRTDPEFLQRAPIALAAAAKRGHLPLLQWLQDQGLESTTGYSLELWRACRRGYLEMVRYLLPLYYTSPRDPFYNEKLWMTAAWKRDSELLRVLVETGYEEWCEGRTPRPTRLQYLVSRGAEDTVFSDTMAMACDAGNVPGVDYLLGVEPGLYGDALGGASLCDEPALMEHLLRQRLPTDEEYARAFSIASEEIQLTALRRLVDLRTPSTECLWEAMCCATGEGSSAMVEYLLSLGVNLCQPSSSEVDDLVFLAAEGGHLEMVQYLVAQGVRHDRHGDAAFHRACYLRRREVVVYLLGLGVSDAAVQRELDLGTHCREILEEYVRSERVRCRPAKNARSAR